MAKTTESGSKSYLFRDLNSNILIGMASDRYGGWIGQNYSEGRYEKGITRRSHKVGTKLAQDLDEFFSNIPKDTRYHIELRAEAYLADPAFEILKKHGVGLVFPHWTWLPPLRKQLADNCQDIVDKNNCHHIVDSKL